MGKPSSQRSRTGITTLSLYEGQNSRSMVGECQELLCQYIPTHARMPGKEM
jgi:hypothetical protein